MQTYITPVRLNKMNQNIPDTCIKCSVDRGTLLHCMWNCPKVQEFWKEVAFFISQMVSINLPMKPEMFILGIIPENILHHGSTCKLVDTSILQAKRLIALYWKKVEKPSIVQWINNMSFCLVMEKITYMLKGKLSSFENIWAPFISFISNSDFGNVLNETGEDESLTPDLSPPPPFIDVHKLTIVDPFVVCLHACFVFSNSHIMSLPEITCAVLLFFFFLFNYFLLLLLFLIVFILAFICKKRCNYNIVVFLLYCYISVNRLFKKQKNTNWN